MPTTAPTYRHAPLRCLTSGGRDVLTAMSSNIHKNKTIMEHKIYKKPMMKIVKLQHQSQLLYGSISEVSGGGTLGSSWTDSGGDSWDESSSSGGGSGLGGWTDNGGNPWE